MPATTEARLASAEVMEKQHEDVEAATRRDTAEVVHQRVAMAALEGTAMQKNGLVDDKSSAGSGKNAPGLPAVHIGIGQSQYHRMHS